ncbi:hypothetical protein K2X14_13550 [Acetobacter sp. TBRC 12305]|uniref:Uncharacterized protein n=1 Tax=Acetobacter garciniae TaxID=2817435 RepID=A0A939HMZ4_9PROT|nr:hypothetical protein [Acetobacter garciniae]MBO1325965.1 hypothetical protein [Acetobacter garciniae]MBX0345865.1 hypothetical protein [Acetobacter garciniae]
MTKPKKDPPPSKEERDLDEALEESFPASDPPSHEDPDKNIEKNTKP